ncbi:MAG: hypothetical protein PUD55_00880 [Firmicutes bacterium]|nr:hypothetical protein [Bacillota bacterium]
MRTGDNIRQRKDGRYEARYIRSRDDSGRAIYASCYGKTYDEAKARREEALDALRMENFEPKGINLLILGAGSHGREVNEIASELNMFDRIDYLDDNPAVENTVGRWEDIGKLRSEYSAAIVAVGDKDTRQRWFARLAELGYSIPKLVHPSAEVSQSASIGVGTVICARAIVSSGSSIGSGCIISAGVVLGRDSKVNNWTHIDVSGTVR